MNPRVVLEILRDVPELRGAHPKLNYPFYKAWVRSLDMSSELKSKTEFDFKDYKFKLPPYDHQKLAINFIRYMPSCGLFMETGTGKTFCALVATEMRIKRGLFKKALIICPKSVTIPSWFEDSLKFTNLKSIVVHKQKNIPWFCPVCAKRYYSMKNARKHQKKEGHEGHDIDFSLEWYQYKTIADRLHAPGYELYITTPETIRNNLDHFINAKFDCVILDESTVIKNKNKTQEAVHKVAQNAKFRIAMTGTPMTNSLEDLYNQGQFISMMFEDTIGEFRSKYFWQHPKHHFIRNPYNWAPDKITGKMEDSCLYIKKADCLDLPERTVMVRDIDMSPACKKAYKVFADDLYLRFQNHEVKADNRLVEILRLHQITNGFVTKPDKSREVIESKPTKIKALEEIVENSNGKVIVWCQYRHDFWAIKHHLKKYNPAIVNGSTSANIEKHVEKFRDDDSCKLMVAHPKSAKFGHTWTWSNTTVYYTFGHSLEDYWQSRDRNYRIGTEHKVNEFFLISSPIEKDIHEAIMSGQDFSKSVMGNFEFTLNKVM